MSFPPLVSPPSLRLAPEDLLGASYVPRSIGELVGHGRVRDAVTSSVLRPADMDKAELGEVEAIWLPLWRIEGSVDGFHVSLGTTTRGGKSRLTPNGGFRHKERTHYLLARSGFAIDPSAKVRVSRADLVGLGQNGEPLGDSAPDAGGRVEADIGVAQARERAELALTREGQPRTALYAKVSVKIHDARLMFYPLYVLRYRYSGEAVEGSSMFFAALSGTTGKVVAARHPSALKSAAGRLRRFFGA